jgi:GT2 family glycosyltransferase/tetratricopeptide (TPR) repeat protein/2-polyprenyl-3-methyl-5-hydroxy-6-metoxy-1,4-benzoquinol methylase
MSSAKSIALVFDNTQRPETTGTYCLAALKELATVQHVLPGQLDALTGQHFDLYLRIDDGLEYQLPAHLRPSAFWAIDTHVSFDRCLAQARSCDLTFAAQRDGAEALRRAGVPSATWLPLACDPAIHRKHDLPKQFDFSFVGNIFDGPRADLLERLRRKFRNHFIGRCYFEEMARTYSASRTVFNRSIKNDINMRVFEALACGSLLLTNDLSSNGQAELFTNGVHLATYSEAEDLLDQLAYYLKHEDIRTRIENAGRELVTTKHTYRQRMEKILMAAEKLPTTVAVTAKPQAIVAKAQAETSGYDHSYFEFDRPELVAMVPPDAREILDIGCGAGRLGRAIKHRQNARVRGIEYSPDAAQAARACLDEVHQGDIEGMESPFAEDMFDAIVCGDVLEHLRDPVAVLRKVRSWLRPTGRLIASIPNVRHHSVIRSLLAGNWTYEPAGLLDRTHLRFFTRREIEKMFFRAGFELESLGANTTPSHDDWVAAGRPGEVRIGPLHIGNLTPQEAQEFHIYQFLVTAKPARPTDFGTTSIVIPVWNQLEFTRRCIDSIRLVTDEAFELIIVNNGSTQDDTPNYLRALAASDPRVKVISNTENRGFPAACNQGIAMATGRQILLLNNDTVVTTGWLRRMLQALHSDPKIGLVGPCSDNVSGEQQITPGFASMEELDGFAWDWGKNHDRVMQDNDRLVGFCLLIRREVIERIGGLDVRYGIGNYDDDDYCMCAREAGYRTVIARDAFIHHHGGATFSAIGIDFEALMQKNARLFREKWNGKNHVPEAKPEPVTSFPQFALHRAPDGGLLLKPNRPSTPPKKPEAVPGGVAEVESLEAVNPVSSLCMIARDNVRTIVPCLTSIRPYVGEMIVLDTGSVDDTPRLCAEMGARVYHFPWPDSFSKARNESIRYARGKWIFWMDTDDNIDEANGKALQELILGYHDPHVLGYVVQVHCPGPSGELYDVTAVDHVKLFRNFLGLSFEFRMHEQIVPSIRRAHGRIEWTDLFVVHSGYDHSPEGQKRKLARDLRLLEMDLRENPGHPFVLFNLGMTYDSVGEYGQAVKWLRQCVANSQSSESHLAKAYSLLVHSLSQMGAGEAALQECGRGLHLFPLDTELRFRCAMVLHELGQLKESAEAYEDLLANVEDRNFSSMDQGLRGFKTRQNLAIVYEEIGELAKAVEQWHAIVHEVPEYRPGWLGLGELLIRMQQWEEARQIGESLEHDGRFAAEGSILLARAAIGQGRTSEAREVFENAISRNGHDLDLLQAYGQFLFEQVDPIEAVPVLQRILHINPGEPATWHNLGTARMRQKQYGAAVQAFQQSLHQRPDSTLTRTNLGYALWDSGKHSEAVTRWQEVLAIDPACAEAANALHRAQQFGQN